MRMVACSKGNIVCGTSASPLISKGSFFAYTILFLTFFTAHEAVPTHRHVKEMMENVSADNVWINKTVNKGDEILSAHNDSISATVLTDTFEQQTHAVELATTSSPLSQNSIGNHFPPTKDDELTNPSASIPAYSNVGKSVDLPNVNNTVNSNPIDIQENRSSASSIYVVINKTDANTGSGADSDNAPPTLAIEPTNLSGDVSDNAIIGKVTELNSDVTTTMSNDPYFIFYSSFDGLTDGNGRADDDLTIESAEPKHIMTTKSFIESSLDDEVVPVVSIDTHSKTNNVLIGNDSIDTVVSATTPVTGDIDTGYNVSKTTKKEGNKMDAMDDVFTLDNSTEKVDASTIATENDLSGNQYKNSNSNGNDNSQVEVENGEIQGKINTNKQNETGETSSPSTSTENVMSLKNDSDIGNVIKFSEEEKMSAKGKQKGNTNVNIKKYVNKSAKDKGKVKSALGHDNIKNLTKKQTLIKTPIDVLVRNTSIPPSSVENGAIDSVSDAEIKETPQSLVPSVPSLQSTQLPQLLATLIASSSVTERKGVEIESISSTQTSVTQQTALPADKSISGNHIDTTTATLVRSTSTPVPSQEVINVTAIENVVNHFNGMENNRNNTSKLNEKNDVHTEYSSNIVNATGSQTITEKLAEDDGRAESEVTLGQTNGSILNSTIKAIEGAPSKPPGVLDYDKTLNGVSTITVTTLPPSKTVTLTTTTMTTTLHSHGIVVSGDGVTGKPITKQTSKTRNDEFFLPADDDAETEMVSATTTGYQTTAIVTEAMTTAPAITNHDSDVEQTTKNRASTIERDSDTIFYISNTEVKVGESSVPTPNSNQENQFFPALYEEDVIIDFRGKNSTSWRSGLNDKYEEDIILSPMKNNFDTLKITDDNLSISYVGESFIDIKENTNGPATTYNDIEHDSLPHSNVIIEPALIPDVSQSIGVPVIAELPPQLDRDIEYQPEQHAENRTLASGKLQVLTHAGNNLQKTQLTAELPKNDEPSDKNMPEKRNGKGNATAEAITNVTAFTVNPDDNSETFNDIQATIITCLQLLFPLIGSLVVLFVIRQIYLKVRRLRENSASGHCKGLVGDNSTDPLAANSRTGSADELKSVESENFASQSTENLDASREVLTKVNEISATNANHLASNGSVITMTMKNNHLIVETEERNDLARDTRETKVHYSPSEKDGVFVVEVARGADSAATAQIAEIINENRVTNNTTLNNIIEYEELNQSNANGNEEVLVHPPPLSCDEDVLIVDEDGAVSMSSPKLNGHDNVKDLITASGINTGLSQSDLSISSSTGSNQGYCYGSQEAYTIDVKGYQSNSPHHNHIEVITNESVETVALLKEVTSKEEPTESIDIEIASDVNGITDEPSPNKLNGSPAIATNSTLDAECSPIANGKCNVDGNIGDEPIGDGADNFDSLLNLPAPPTCDEIKQLHEITLLESNTLDSLPPPPPDTQTDTTILNGQS